MERHFSVTPHRERRKGLYDRRCSGDRRSSADRRTGKKSGNKNAGDSGGSGIAKIIQLLFQLRPHADRRRNGDRRKADRRSGLDRRNSDFKMALSADEISVLLGHPG